MRRMKHVDSLTHMATREQGQGSATGPAMLDLTSPTPGYYDPDFLSDDATPTPDDSTPASIDIDTATEKFAEAISTNLGAHAEPTPDDAIHRFDDPEKRSGNKNCWVFMDQTGTYGVYGNWSTGERYEWFLDDFQTISDDELATILAKAEAARLQRDEQRRIGNDEASKKAEQLLNGADPADSDHPYLRNKAIPSANALQDGSDLLIPLRNAEGDTRNLQRINTAGKKRFLKGGEVSGNFSLIGADELPTEGSLIVCEGWATGVSLHASHGWPVAAAMNAGNLIKVCKALRAKLPETVTLVVAADDDRRTEGNPGLAKAFEAAEAITAEVIRPEFPCDDCNCTDFNDLEHCKRQTLDQAHDSPDKPARSNPGTAGSGIIPLRDTLPPVKPLVAAMLPAGFVGFVMDVSARLQIPPDYIAVGALTVAAGIVGGKRRIHPKQHDDWLVTPTMWGGLVGTPSTMKSATMGAAQKPLHELEKEMAIAHEEALIVHALDSELAEEYLKDVKKQAKAIYSKDREKAIQTVREADVSNPVPTRPRIIINDATIEKVGELMRENPNGLLLVRDELSGWFAKMGLEDYQGDRAFYLECFEGLSGFVWDRIGRGTIENEKCVLSILGGIQPSKIAPVIRNAVQGSVDDGLIQRFQLAVWPNVQPGWKWIDQAPDEEAYGKYRDALRQLHALPAVDDNGASINLRFSTTAQALYITWMEKIHGEMRSDTLHPVMQSHLAKMPKTIAGLALLFELIDGGRTEVGEAATAKAILWADYLQSHANRLYSLSTNTGMTGAKLIHSRLEKLPEIFTARDVLRKNWTGLSTTLEVADALERLVEHRYLTELPVPTSAAGGRPTMRYRWHQSLVKKP